MNNQPNNFKFKALETACYCPKYNDNDTFIDSLEIGNFDTEKIKEQVRNSVPLLSYNDSHKPLIIEILDVLDQYRHNFLIDHQKHIGFYWSGIPVYRIDISNDIPHNKLLHISLQKYKSEKEDIESEHKTQKLLMYGLGGSLLLGGIIAGLTLFRK